MRAASSEAVTLLFEIIIFVKFRLLGQFKRVNTVDKNNKLAFNPRGRHLHLAITLKGN